MRQFWLVALGSWLTALVFIGPVGAENLPFDIGKIKKRGELIVAMTGVDQPPFFFVNRQGELDGLDVFLAKTLANALGVKVRFNRTPVSFNDTVQTLVNDEADIAITKLSRTLPRAQVVLFSEPYVVLHQALLINRLLLTKYTNESAIPNFVRNFKGKIGVIINSSYAVYAKTNFPQAEIIEFPSWEAVVNAVINGDVLAAYRDDLEVRKFMNQHPGASLKLKLVVFKDRPDPIAMAMAHDRYQLKSFVDILLQNLNLQLTSIKIIEQYGSD